MATMPPATLRNFETEGVAVRVVMGEANGLRSPVASYSPTLYLECRMPAGSSFNLPGTHRELAAYVVAGEVVIDQGSNPESAQTTSSTTMRLTALSTSQKSG